MLAAQLLGRLRIGLASLLEDYLGVAVDKSGQKANWSARPITPKLLTYASLDVWYLPALRDILTKELTKLHRLDWLDQQCRAQIESGSSGFAPATDSDWRIGRSERPRGRGLSATPSGTGANRRPSASTPSLQGLRQRASSRSPRLPSRVTRGIHPPPRQSRQTPPAPLPAFAEALHAGLARDPKTLPLPSRSRSQPRLPHPI